MHGDSESISDILLEQLNPDHFKIDGPHILSVSGGRDSMLLLYIFHDLFSRGYLKHEPVVFHLHHGLRPNADLEMEFVNNSCSKLGLSFYQEKKDTADFSRKRGLGLEAAGRTLRYRLLAGLAKKHPGACAVTGHHADDYTESLLIHLIRGGGPGALSTLNLFAKIEEVVVFHPLIFFNRRTINDLVRKYSIPYMDDESNYNEKFLRNRLRKHVMPSLLSEGLDTIRLWQNFHPESGVRKIYPAGLIPDRISIDRRFFINITPDECKTLLDTALYRLGLQPANRGVIYEILKQLESADEETFRLKYDRSEYMLWSARKGPVWILKKKSNVFEVFKETIDRESLIISYAGKTQKYTLARDEEFTTWFPGLRVLVKTDKKRDTGSKKIKKVFQELHLPPPVRWNLPLIVNKKTGYVIRVCASFWEDNRDLLFYH